jgi:hypothetical protein
MPLFNFNTNLSLLRSTASPPAPPPALNANVGAFQDLQQRAGLLQSPEAEVFQPEQSSAEGFSGD